MYVESDISIFISIATSYVYQVRQLRQLGVSVIHTVCTDQCRDV